MDTEHGPPTSSSTGRCCCLLVFFLLFVLALLCVAFVFTLRPKKPVFTLHSIQLDSFKLGVASSKEVYVPSSSMASLSFITQNPNKVGIRYSSSVLGVLCDGVPVGVIAVPTFYQPPRSGNVSVLMHFSFGRLNLTRLTRGGLLSSSSYDGLRVVEIRIVGGISCRPHILNFPLPKIKVAVDCQITVDYGAITLSKGISLLRTPHKALLLSSFPYLSQKCSLALCI